MAFLTMSPEAVVMAQDRGSPAPLDINDFYLVRPGATAIVDLRGSVDEARTRTYAAHLSLGNEESAIAYLVDQFEAGYAPVGAWRTEN